MGRPRLYHTEEERLSAKWSSSKTYYEKNRKRISLKNKAKYREKKRMLPNASELPLRASTSTKNYTHPPNASRYEKRMLPNASGSLPPASTLTKNYTHLPNASRSPPADKDELEEQLVLIFGHSLAVFLDHAIEDISTTASPNASIRSLEDNLHRVQEMRKRVRARHDEILQIDGACVKLCKVQVVLTRLKDVIFALEEVVIHADVDLEGTLQRHRMREFFYQTSI